MVTRIASTVPEKVSLDSVDERDINGFEPRLKPVGYHLQPDSLRPSVWEYESGESNRRHKHETQEELYTVLDGRVRIEFDDDGVELEPGNFVVVSPDEWRQITALEDATLLAIGAPNVSHDAIFPGEE